MPHVIQFTCPHCLLLKRMSSDYNVTMGATFLTNDGTLRLWLNLDCKSCGQRSQLDTKMPVGSVIHRIYEDQGGKIR